MTSVTKLPKHVLSITRPNAQHDYQCVWHEGLFNEAYTIPRGQAYVRVVWEDDNEVIHSDHVCVRCWAKE